MVSRPGRSSAGTQLGADARAANGGRVIQGGRAKAYRPLPATERRVALEEALAAYERGDFFLAHELLEPAWMGTANELERELYQGLIKLAAAFVHYVRGNPEGVAKNLRGARARLGRVVMEGGSDAGLDLPALLANVDTLLSALGDAVHDYPGSREARHGPVLDSIKPPHLKRRVA